MSSASCWCSRRADLRLDHGRAVRCRRADDRVLRDPRLCHPECDVRHLADARLRGGRLRLQEDRHSVAPLTLALVLGKRTKDAIRLSMTGSGGDPSGSELCWRAKYETVSLSTASG